MDKNFHEKRQFGGTATISINTACHRIILSGVDPTKMGRWSWSLFRGKNNLQVRIVTLYRPVFSTGATSTYQQQKRHQLEHDIDTCPREQLLLDLTREITQWNSDGNRIIVMGDFNDDVRGSTILQTFKKLDMKEAIITKHGNNAPNTFNNGSVPIDGIFISNELSILAGGYTSTKWGMASDHRLLWLDIMEVELMGTTAPPVWRPKARRLKTDDPKVVNSFLHIRNKMMLQDNMMERIQALNKEIIDNTMSNSQQQELESLDKLRVAHILQADKKCRKLKMGDVPWSPQLQTSINRIRYFRACVSRYQHHRVNSRTLQKQFNATDIEVKLTTFEEASEALKREYKRYNDIKLSGATHRTSYLRELAERKAKHGQKNQPLYLNSL
jgi:hypothetical protein